MAFLTRMLRHLIESDSPWHWRFGIQLRQPCCLSLLFRLSGFRPFLPSIPHNFSHKGSPTFKYLAILGFPCAKRQCPRIGALFGSREPPVIRIIVTPQLLKMDTQDRR